MECLIVKPGSFPGEAMHVTHSMSPRYFMPLPKGLSTWAAKMDLQPWQEKPTASLRLVRTDFPLSVLCPCQSVNKDPCPFNLMTHISLQIIEFCTFGERIPAEGDSFYPAWSLDFA